MLEALQQDDQSACPAQVVVFDIKAGNVLLEPDGVTAKITDVGLSKMLAGSNTATLLVRAEHAPCCLRSITTRCLPKEAEIHDSVLCTRVPAMRQASARQRCSPSLH